MVDGSPPEYDRRDKTRQVDGGPTAMVLKGVLPTLAEIAKLPGRTSREVWNSSARVSKWREEG
jgi:hypothetical protein